MPEKEVPQSAETTAETPAAPPQSDPAPTPEPTHEPITEAKKPSRSSMWLVAGALAFLVLAVSAYAYSQGYFGAMAPTTASPETATTTPTVSDDVTSLQTTSDQINQDLTDLSDTVSGLDGLDLTGDEAPAL